MLSPKLSKANNLKAAINEPSTLPDSLEDAAQIAASSCLTYANSIGVAPSRCRVDFDTTVGDETYTRLKSSTEFMQNFVTFACCSFIPQVLEQRQRDMQAVMNAKSQLMAMEDTDIEENTPEIEAKIQELQEIISKGGISGEEWNGGLARIYFPDEGNAALAKRDWVMPSASSSGLPSVPSCVRFNSMSSIQVDDVSKDVLHFYFCPEAAESEKLETILYANEVNCPDLKMSVLVNPNLVDMGVTGFGMTGRLLRERLIDPLTNAYYLRTLPWGALTRVYPFGFTVYQEDEDEADGYRCIRVLDRLPSNPEVEDIYDFENGNELSNNNDGGAGAFFKSVGNFIDGMTKL